MGNGELVVLDSCTVLPCFLIIYKVFPPARQLTHASSSLRGDTPMSGCGDGGVEDSTTGAYEGA